jgi:ElaB/YqjD/DUF883 family membrane-anchored ribosome-binding protein
MNNTSAVDAEPTEDLQGKAQEVVQQVQEKAGEIGGQAVEQVRSQVDSRSTEAAAHALTISEAARSASEELRSRGEDLPARIIDEAATRVEQLGTYLRDSSADRILRDAEEFGRKQPWAVIGGGLILGFAASRFLKASSSRRYASQRPASPAPQARPVAPTASASRAPQTAMPGTPPLQSGSFQEPVAPVYSTGTP